MPDCAPPRALFRLPRRLLLGAALLGAAGCMVRAPIDAPPKSVVFFTSFSADLDSEAHQVINSVAADAVANPGRTVLVQGYADATVGTVAANRTLSQLRSQVVADALAAHGVNPQKIVIRPRGPSNVDPGIESRRVEVSFGS